MNHLSVDMEGRWILYSGAVLPIAAKAMGTVRRKCGDTGALVLMPTGLFVQINAGAIRSLPQFEIIRAIKKAKHE